MSMMPTHDPHPPSYQGDQSAIWREIRALWQLVRKGAGVVSNRTPSPAVSSQIGTGGHPGISPELSRSDHKHVVLNEIIFSRPGPTLASTSPPYRVLSPQVTITQVHVTVGTASSASSVFTVDVNGTGVVSVSLGPNAKTNQTVDLGIVVQKNDLITVTAQPGSGLADSVVHVLME